MGEGERHTIRVLGGDPGEETGTRGARRGARNPPGGRQATKEKEADTPVLSCNAGGPQTSNRGRSPGSNHAPDEIGSNTSGCTR